jgi:hypothetical protein
MCFNQSNGKKFEDRNFFGISINPMSKFSKQKNKKLKEIKILARWPNDL